MGRALPLALGLLLSMPAVVFAQDEIKKGFYIGAGVGGGRIEAELKDLGLVPTSVTDGLEGLESDDFKNTALTYKFFAGWRILDFFAIEGGYMEFDDPDESFCFTDLEEGGCSESRGSALSGQISSSAWTIELPTDGLTIYAVGIYPFSPRFEIFAKLGGIAWDAEGTGWEEVSGLPTDSNGNLPPGIPTDPNAPPPDLPSNCPGGSLPYKGAAVPPPPNACKQYSDDGFDVAGGIGMNFNMDSGVSIRTEFEYFDIGDFDTAWFLSASAFYTF